MSAGRFIGSTSEANQDTAESAQVGTNQGCPGHREVCLQAPSQMVKREKLVRREREGKARRAEPGSKKVLRRMSLQTLELQTQELSLSSQHPEPERGQSELSERHQGNSPRDLITVPWSPEAEGDLGDS